MIKFVYAYGKPFEIHARIKFQQKYQFCQVSIWVKTKYIEYFGETKEWATGIIPYP